MVCGGPYNLYVYLFTAQDSMPVPPSSIIEADSRHILVDGKVYTTIADPSSSGTYRFPPIPPKVLANEDDVISKRGWLSNSYFYLALIPVAPNAMNHPMLRCLRFRNYNAIPITQGKHGQWRLKPKLIASW
jgi:hypothetical protein